MFGNGWHRAASILAGIAACVGPASTASAASALPASADVHLGAAVDIPTFEQSVALRYNVHFRKVVATDIDRDGDVDFVAATDVGLVVWVNDGEGHLTSEAPLRAPIGAAGASGTTWQDQDRRVELSIQNPSPSVPFFGAHAHGPPARVARRRPSLSASLRTDVSLGSRPSRAPPL